MATEATSEARHYQVGDRMLVFIHQRSETVRVNSVYIYPDGSVAYGFYSDLIGRHGLKDCENNECGCGEHARARGARDEHWIGDRKGNLIQLS